MDNYVTEVAERLSAKGIEIGHYDLRFVKPLDENLLHEVFKKYQRVITLEDGCVQGGFGSAVLEFMADHGYQASVKRLGLPDVVSYRVLARSKTGSVVAIQGYSASGKYVKLTGEIFRSRVKLPSTWFGLPVITATNDESDNCQLASYLARGRTAPC